MSTSDHRQPTAPVRLRGQLAASGIRVVRILVAPALALMNRMNYVSKFLLIGLLLLLPFAYVTSLMIEESDQQITFNQKERYGVAYISPALRLLAHLERSRNLAVAAAGAPDRARTAQLGEEWAAIQRMILEVDGVDLRHRDDFATETGKFPCADRWREIRRLLIETPGRRFGGPEEALARYDELCSAVKDWILNYAANYSNLILDPDLDSYWLMDAFVGKLPALMDDIGQASSRALVLWSQRDDIQPRLALHGQYTEAASTLDAFLDVNLKTAYSSNNAKARSRTGTASAGGALEPALAPAVQTVVEKSRRFLAFVRGAFVLPESPQGAPADLVDTGEQALIAIDALLSRVGPRLDDLIAARVEKYRRSRAQGKLAAELATFLHVYLFIAFYIAVHASVSKLGDFTQKMIAGTTEHFQLDSRDEMGAVAASYNKINTALNQTRSLKTELERRTSDLEKSEEQSRRRAHELSEANQTLRQARDERERVEIELRQAQKLESVGRLASGIAHEINTPVQYVGDNMHFLNDAMVTLAGLLTHYRSLHDRLAGDPNWAEATARLAHFENEADLGYLLEHVPSAFQSCQDGLARVAAIVRSMKSFAHPGQKDKVPADINQAIETTLAIARNEYKYVADVETDFATLPPVLCHVSELNQVFLNLLVNAAHAIGDVVKGTDRRGVIAFTTRLEGGQVVISIRDSGSGIPEVVRERVFEPFFTTKEIGRGTGQGLAIARSVVVDKHGGTIAFDTELGRGTVFTIRLPVGGDATPEPADSEATTAPSSHAA